jgi:predicted transcriptional regulator
MKTEDIHIGRIIQQKFNESKISINDFATKLNCCRSNIYKIFQSKSIDIKRLIQISEILCFDFISLYKKQSNSKISVKLEIDGNKVNVITND